MRDAAAPVRAKWRASRQLIPRVLDCAAKNRRGCAVAAVNFRRAAAPTARKTVGFEKSDRF